MPEGFGGAVRCSEVQCSAPTRAPVGAAFTVYNYALLPLELSSIHSFDSIVDNSHKVPNSKTD